MPKKFATENPKVAAARDRKETAKKDATEKKQKAADDAFWTDDDKLANRKVQRKDDAETKRLEAQKRKEENKLLAEAEMANLHGKTTAAPKKVTKADIDRQRESQLLARIQEENRKRLEAQKIAVVETFEENVNKLVQEEGTARSVSDAIAVLDGDKDTTDKHPEKRMKAAYLAFEEKRLPQLKEEHPTFRLSQLKQLLRKEWQGSPENPLNAALFK